MLNLETLPQLARSFEQHAELAAALAESTAKTLNDAIAERGCASIAFSGGSTPALFLAELSKQRVDWLKVQATLVDDRCVPASEERSNARMLQQKLFDALQVSPMFYPLFVEGESVADCNSRLAELSLPFDCLILGMGDDAHTASFFPDADNLEEMLDLSDDSLVGETRSAASIERRLTFRLPTVLAARSVVLHICGENKWRVLTEVSAALGATDSENESALAALDRKFPILSVLRRSSLHREDGVPAAIYFASNS